MPTLILHTPDGGQVQHRVEGAPYRIGRQADNHLVLKDGGVSKHHCELVYGGSRWSLRDLGSANGTSVNGIRAGESQLASGDVLLVGPFQLVFHDDAGAEPEAHEPVDDDPTLTGAGQRGGAHGAGQRGWAGHGSPHSSGSHPAHAPAAAHAAPPPPAPVVQLGPAPSAAPRVQPLAEVEVVSGPLRGKRVPVGPAGIGIGAGSGNELTLDDPYASRRHARVEPLGGEFRIVDLGSTNGIVVEGAAVRESRLRPGSRFQVGSTQLVLVPPGAPGAAPPPLSRSLAPPPPPAPRGTATAHLPALGHPPQPALPPPPPGHVRIGGLTFTPVMAAVLGLASVLMVFALAFAIYQSLAPMVTTEQVKDSGEVLKAARAAYDAGDWKRAEQLVATVRPDDPRAREADEIRKAIGEEAENLKRVDVIKMLLDQGVPEKARERFMEIPRTSRYFAEAQKLVDTWLQRAAEEAVQRGRDALAVDDVVAAREALDQATRYDAAVPGLGDLLSQIEARDAVLAATRPGYVSQMAAARPGSGRGRAGSGRASAAAPQTGQVEAVRRRYLSGDVDGARGALDELMKSPDGNVVAEAQDLIGRIERVERNLDGGQEALRKGDHDTADARLRQAADGIAAIDPEWRSPRAQEVKRVRVDQLLQTGRRAFAAGDYPAANRSWTDAWRMQPSNSMVDSELGKLEEKAREIYAKGYVAEKDGTEARVKEAVQWYKQVLSIAPPGERFQYRAKAERKLKELGGAP